MTTKTNLLDKVVVFILDIRAYTGRKQLSVGERQTLGLKGDNVLTVGHKKIVNPKDLNIFPTLRKKAERLLRKHGIHFLGGYAVPVVKAAEISAELKTLQVEYEMERDTFFSTFKDKVDAWANANPKWRAVILNHHQSVDLKHTISFRFYSVAVQASPVDSDMSGVEAEFGTRLFDEIAKDAKQAFALSLRGNEQVTQKAIRPFRRMLEKVRGLEFVHPDAYKIGDYIESTLARIPSVGPLDAAATTMLTGLALTLAQGDGTLPMDNKRIEDIEDTPTPPCTPEIIDTPATSDTENEDEYFDQAVGWF